MQFRIDRKFLAICIGVVASLGALIASQHDRPAILGKARASALFGHRFPILAVAFDPSGTRLTSAAGFPTSPREDLELMVWDIASGSLLRRHTGFQANLAALTFSRDGSNLVTAGAGSGMRMWDVGTMRETAWQDTCRVTPSCLAFSPDGRHLISANRENEILYWDRSGKLLWTKPSGHDRFAQALAFSPDGRLLASGGTDGVIQIWEVATGKSSRARSAHLTIVHATAFSPDGRTLATGDRNGVVKLWDSSTGEERCSWVCSQAEARGSTFAVTINGLAFSPDGQTLAAAIGTAVELWDVATNSLISVLDGEDGKVHCLAYSPDGTHLASGSQNGVIRVLDMSH